MTRRDLIAGGMTRKGISDAVTQGALTVLAPGYYVDPVELGRFDEHRHLSLALGVVANMADGTALAGVSAAVNLGLPVLGADLSHVHVARAGMRASGTQVTSISVLHRNVTPQELAPIGEVLSTSVARTIIDVARTQSVRAATSAGDAALRRKLCDESDLKAQFERMGPVHGCGRARSVIARLDGRAESPLESWSRLVIARSRLPMPDLQREIFDEHARLVGRVDFFWEEFGVVGECDGMGKYFGEYSEKSVREILDEEKFRAQELQDLGYVVVRWSWRELLHRPQVVLARIERAIAGARAIRVTG